MYKTCSKCDDAKSHTQLSELKTYPFGIASQCKSFFSENTKK